MKTNDEKTIIRKLMSEDDVRLYGLLYNENVSLKSSFERWLHVLKFGDRYTDLKN